MPEPPNLRQEIIAEIVRCSRCDQNHYGLTFKRFTRPSNTNYTHWALCPNTGEPVLLVIYPTPGDMAASRQSPN